MFKLSATNSIERLYPGDPARQRALRVAVQTLWVAIFASFVFALTLAIIGQYLLMGVTIFVAFLYVISLLTVFFGSPYLGRLIGILFGNLAIFIVSFLTKGEAAAQYLLFSVTLAPILFFSFEERRGAYWLSLVPVLAYCFGDHYQWNLISVDIFEFNELSLKPIRYISVLTTFFQIFFGAYVFMKQSRRFEKESEELLQKLGAKYEKESEAHKMLSLGRMAAGISHEINNPLTSLFYRAYFLRLGLRSNSEKHKMLDHLSGLEEDAQRVGKIVRSLRVFSRSSEFDQIERVNLEKIIQRAFDLFERKFSEAGISVSIDQGKNLFVDCVRSDLLQVFINLLHNSFEALNGVDGGAIFVNIEEHGDDAVIRFGDNGCGITLENRTKVMEPFFTTKSIGSGQGLGLSVSKGIIERHNGTITLAKLSGNTTFEIFLPKSRVVNESAIPV